MTWDAIQCTVRSGRALLHSLEDEMQFTVSIRHGQLQTASYTGPWQLYLECKCFKPKEFLGMTAKRKRTMENEDIAHKLFLDSDSYAHTSEYELLFHRSDSVGDQEETHTGNTQ
jgi:hypothetical protein